MSVLLISLLTLVYACSKGGGGGGTTPNPCTGVTITVTGTTVSPTLGSSNGSITASATGGSTGFTYSINGGAFQSSVTGAIVNPTSTTVSNGSINATASGSTGFNYSINSGAFQASGNFTNLAAGSYTIVAKDVNGCTGSAIFTLTAPNPCAGIIINVTATTVNPTSAAATNGSISASAAGSTGFTFNINGGAFQATGNFNNLGQGTFTIVAKDLNVQALLYLH